MPRYVVPFVQTAATYIEVEADSKDEAVELAWQEVDASLCHHCSRRVELSGDWDPDHSGVEVLG